MLVVKPRLEYFIQRVNLLDDFVRIILDRNGEEDDLKPGLNGIQELLEEGSEHQHFGGLVVVRKGGV